jgi:hypothetical protein
VSETPALVPGRIHGVRLWTVTVGCGSMALCGLNGSAWMVGGEATRAECSPFTRDYGCRERRGHAPAPDCSCGLYSMHPWPDQISDVAGSLLENNDLAIPVMGIVEAWGRIEVHADGIRAEYARPRALVHFRDSFPSDYAEILAVLARTYRVGIVSVQEAGSVVSYCAEHAPGMDPAAVERLLHEPRVPDEEQEEPDDEDWEVMGASNGVSIPADFDEKRPNLLSRVAQIAVSVVFGVLFVAWYGFWAVLGVSILGAIFLGWWDEPPPPPPKVATALHVIDQRLVRDGPTSTYIAVVHNTSRRLAAVGVYPFGEFRDRQGHKRGEPDKRHRIELAPTIAPGATGVVYDDLNRSMPKATRLDIDFAAKMARSRPAPFSVRPVRINQRLCIITARLHSDRPLDRSRVSAVGRYDGRLGVAGTFTVGPVPRGSSTQVLYRLDPDTCTHDPPAITGYPAPDPRQVLTPRRRQG